MKIIAHNPAIKKLLRPEYSLRDLDKIERLLKTKGTLKFSSLKNGLYPAAASAGRHDVSGYQNTWVRDNVHVAHAHYVTGDTRAAARTATALMQFFLKETSRFRKVIRHPASANEPMNRPHIRFDGEKIAELKEIWSHAQNDALGFFLWFYCKLAREGLVSSVPKIRRVLKLFPSYFKAIRYWRDRDSGHWEESRKVSASSIGCVVAGLRAMKELFPDEAGSLDRLITPGVKALKKILPCECRGPRKLLRRYDGALLFLLYPLAVEEVVESFSEKILRDVTHHLEGLYGIRRYLGDSYWCADYKKRFPSTLWTVDLSADTAVRDTLLQPGEEAQWCIFDPILSVIHGQRGAKRLQVHYLNRALGQITGKAGGKKEFCCPESYYLENGKYVPNDYTPLLWTQANLWLALHHLRRRLSVAG